MSKQKLIQFFESNPTQFGLTSFGWSGGNFSGVTHWFPKGQLTRLVKDVSP